MVKTTSTKMKTKAAPAKVVPKKGKSKSVARQPSSSSSSSSGSDNESGSEDGDGDDRAAMLAALQKHSMSMFGLDLPAESSAQGAARSASEAESDSDSEAGAPVEDDDDFDDEFDDGWGEGGEFVSDSEDGMDFDAMMSSAKKAKGKAKKTKGKEKVEAKPGPVATPVSRAPVEVVFADTPGRASAVISKAEKRAFLTGNSAKIMGLQPEDQPGSGKRKRRSDDDEEEQSNQRLDKTLHDMLLTSLLPSAAQDAASRPVDKRAAMSGRLLELANYSLPGDGEGVVRGSNLSSHPANVRTGLLHAQQRRANNARAEAEAAGSWVKGKGGLGDLGRKGAGVRPGKERETRTFGTTTKKKGMDGRKNERAKGLGMGVGHFGNGALKIDESTIARMSGGGGKKPRKGGKKGMRGW